MKVSVIIPVYNRRELITRCLDSLVQQDYSNMEIIVVDDGSTDNTRDFLRKAAENDSRIKLAFQENAGPSKARNTGLDMCTGAYIAFVDSDDIVPGNYISRLVSAINGADISVCNRKRIYFDGASVVMGGPDGKYTAGTFIEKSLKGEIHSTAAFITPTNRMFTAALLKENNIRFNEELHNGEDTLFNLQAIEKAAYAAVTTATEYIAVDTEDSLSFSTSLKRFECYKYINPLLSRIVEDCNISGLDVYLSQFFLMGFFYKTSEILNTNHPKEWKIQQLDALLAGRMASPADVLKARGKALPWLLLSLAISTGKGFWLLVWFVLAAKLSW